MPSLDKLDALRIVELACFEAGEPERVCEAQADKASSLDFFAIRVPQLRQLTKVLDHPDLDSIGELECWSFVMRTSKFFEPKSLALLRYQQPEQKTRLREEAVVWSEYVENWAHCDLLGSLLANLSHSEWPFLHPYFKIWNASENHWLERLSIVGLVKYVGKNSVVHPFPVARALIEPHLTNRNIYVSRAVGWVLREYLKSDQRASTLKFVRENWDLLMSPARAKIGIHANRRPE